MSIDVRTSSTTLRALQVSAVLAVVNLAWQFVTAGQLFPQQGSDELHAGGAILLHVLTGVVAIAAWLHWRNTSGPGWPTVLAAVVFVLSFVQAYTGGYDTLWIHVPGAMVLTVGSVWVAVWAFSSRA
ncbi:MAG: hypothetical protein ABI181_12900 [Mycobacteriaceae bacterium]